jgi:hypothetical protein
MPTHAATTASLRAPPAGSSATAVATAAPRTLTEELEKVEQSITLTLQEIDQNFSTSHRIITSSILPIVEEYALQSQAVWQSSKVRSKPPLHNLISDAFSFGRSFLNQARMFPLQATKS